jgi:transposase
MTLYIGVDFHPHLQTVAWCDTETGETKTFNLFHDNLEDVRNFYQSIPKAIVGIEATSKALWFEKLLFETGHKLLVGNSVEIRARSRSRHKNNERDANLILDLLLKGEFPTIWRRPPQSNQILEIVGLRDTLVRDRTQTYNRLQALAHSVGLAKGKMKTLRLQKLLKAAEVPESVNLQRTQLFELLEKLNQQISQSETWLKQKAELDQNVKLLRTQKGVGYLTALVVVHTIGDVTRFTRVSKQVPEFAGIVPAEKSTGNKRSFGSITKAGSPLLRFFLGQAAHLATRTDSRLKAFYKRLSKRKSKAVAKTATARKLLVKLAIMLRDNITAEEFDLCGRTVGDARRLHGQKK